MNPPSNLTKTHLPYGIPKAPPHTRVRQRTLAFFAGIEQLPLLVIVGSAGSGKSTVLAHWQQTTPLPNQSLSLVPGDNHDHIFWPKLIQAVARTAAPIAQALGHFLSGPQALPIPSLLNLLREALNQLQGTHVLVLDDFHVINQQGLIESLRHFIAQLPSTLRLVIASRSMPPLPLSKWALAGHARVISNDTLSFSLEEARHFFDAQWSDSQVQLAWHTTEGWAAGLQLLAISGPRQSQAKFSHQSATSAASFLYQEVFQDLPDELRDFLHATALLDDFTPELAQAMQCQVDVFDILAQLETKQLFLIPMQHEGPRFRYHHMFRDFLRKDIGTRAPEKAQQLHQKAMQWFADQQEWELAFQHGIQAKQFPQAAIFLEKLAPEILSASAFPSLLSLAKQLPEPYKKQDPALCLHLATAELMTYQWNPFQTRMAQLESHLEKGDVPPLIRAGYHALQGNLSRQMGHLSKAVDHCNKALELWFAGPEARRAEVLIVKGACEFFKADFTQARLTLIACIRSCQKGDDTEVVYLGAKALLGDLDLLLGSTAKAERELKATLHEIEVEPKRLLIPMAAMVFVSYADLLLERQQPQKAATLLSQALSLAEKGQLSGPMLRILLSQCRVYRALNSSEQAQEALDQAISLVEKANIQEWQQNLLWLEASKHELERNDTDQAQSYFSRLVFPHENEVSFTQPQRALIAWELSFKTSRNSAKTEPLDIIQTMEDQHRWLEWLRFQTLQLQIWVCEGKFAQAFQRLETCLQRAEHHHLIRPLLDGGKPLAELAQKLFSFAARHQAKPSAYSHGFLANLLHQFEAAGLLKAPSQPAANSQAAVDGLTRREAEVLAHIATGANNAQITETLHVSLATLKTHINRIYSKLRIKSRAQAILKAQAMGLSFPKSLEHSPDE